MSKTEASAHVDARVEPSADLLASVCESTAHLYLSVPNALLLEGLAGLVGLGPSSRKLLSVVGHLRQSFANASRAAQNKLASGSGKGKGAARCICE